MKVQADRDALVRAVQVVNGTNLFGASLAQPFALGAGDAPSEYRLLRRSSLKRAPPCSCSPSLTAPQMYVYLLGVACGLDAARREEQHAAKE